MTHVNNSDDYKKIKEDISVIVRDEIRSFFKESTEKNPYALLEEWSQTAMEKFKKDLTNKVIQEKEDKFRVRLQNVLKIAKDDPELKIKNESDKLDKMINEIIGLIEEIKEEERRRIVKYSNPLSESRVFRYLPWLKNFTRRTQRDSRNWIGLLLTGMGLTFIGRGIWDASEWMFSIQGSIIIGIFILALIAWMERRKVFSLFGQE